MNNNQLQSFMSVVESQSFNQAEKKLYVSRQALKKQIDSLESELGFNLFVRSHQGTTLTPVGEEFYNGIKDITEQTDALINKCRDFAKHEYTIRIGNPTQPRLILENAFNEFAKEYSYIKQEVVFIDEPKTLALVLDGTVDVAECILSPQVEDDRISFIKLSDMPYKCILAPNHPLADRAEIVPEDLNGFTVGVRRSSNSRIIQALKRDCTDITLIETRGSSQEQQHIFTVFYNNGIFLSRAYYASFMQPLVTVPFKCDITAECGIIFKKNASPIVRNFINVVKKCFPSS